MRKLCVLIVLALLACLQAAGQDYVLVREVTLAGSAEAVTVQQPASSAARVVRFVGAYLYCSADCAVTLERDGTAATATSATPTPVLLVVAAAKATAYVASNVGVGTVLGKYTIPAGGSLPLNLSRLALFGDGTAQNVTVRFGTMTGTVKAVVLWTEER